jgi:hypothetical protein
MHGFEISTILNTYSEKDNRSTLPVEGYEQAAEKPGSSHLAGLEAVTYSR